MNRNSNQIGTKNIKAQDNNRIQNDLGQTVFKPFEPTKASEESHFSSKSKIQNYKIKREEYSDEEGDDLESQDQKCTSASENCSTSQ